MSANTITTPEPIIFTFDGSLDEWYVKYLEFELTFDEIPSWETRDIDVNTGRNVLSEEEKGATMLTFYAYNFQEEKWEPLDMVTYTSQKGPYTYSYVADRKFTSFEPYFMKSASEDSYYMQVIASLDCDASEYYTLDMGFSASNVEANLYHDIHEEEEKLTPSVIFDVDLTDYFGNPDISVEKLELDLNYLTNIIADEVLFNQYALIEEHVVLNVRHKYLEKFGR